MDDDKIIRILKLVSDHLADNYEGYKAISSEYYFGRLCDSEELFKGISKIVKE